MDINVPMINSKKVSGYKRNKETEERQWYMVFCLKRIRLLLLIPISLLILLIVQNNKYIAEYVFARGLYKWFSQGLSLLTGIFPFSLMEIEIVVFPIVLISFIIVLLCKFVSRVRKKQVGAAYILAKGILNTACVLSIVLFQFVLLAGVNYYRYSFASYSGLEIKNSTVDELYNLCLELAEEAAEIRGQLHMQKGIEDENGVLQLSESSWSDLSKTAAEAFEKLAKKYPVLDGNYGSPKPVLFSEVMSRMEITGIFWPFTVEANINVDTSDYSIPATMGHELAHLHGFMREDEANFISYLVCKDSDNRVFQYSGIMLALSYAGSQLYKQNQELYQNVREVYNTSMVADLREEYYYWKHFEDTVISTISNTMNDNYLKANNQQDGTKSYGRMVDLLLAEYRQNHTEE